MAKVRANLPPRKVTLTVEDEFLMCCGGCDKKLLHVVVHGKSETMVKLTALCPCGDTSFIRRVPTLAYRYSPEDKLYIENIESNPDESTERVILKNLG